MSTTLPTGTTITPENEATWLASRALSLGASEAATALGVSPWAAPIDLWIEKTTGRRTTVENEAMAWGKRLEPVILEEYERRTMSPVFDRQLFVRDDVTPFMSATLDGLTYGKLGRRIVEVKTASSHADGWGEDGSDQIPDHYRIQVQHQLAIMRDCEAADVAALIGGQQLRIFHIERDEALIQVIREGEELFWDHVIEHTPPTYGKMDARVLAILNPECYGAIELTAEQAYQLDRYEELGGRIKRDEAFRDEIKVEILKALGNHKYGNTLGFTRVQRFLQETKEYTVKPSTKHFIKLVKDKGK